MVAFGMVCPSEGASIQTAIADNDGNRYTRLNSYPLKKHGSPDLKQRGRVY